MGIRGLSTYVHSDNAYWTSIARLHEKGSEDSNILIIDGSNLVNILHQSSGLNSLFGGQYQELYEIMRAFFSAVLNSGFRPIVILEEVAEEEKRDTVFKRRLEKLRDLNTCVHNGETIHRLPGMGYIILSELVSELGLECTCCDSEADPVIAALASRLGATVVSNDSDFFLTKVPSVISLNCLSWDWGELVGHFFNLDAFLSHHGLHYWAAPFIVLLLGNDTIPGQLLYAIQTVRSDVTRHLIGDKISRVFKFLASFKSETSLLEFLRPRFSPAQWRLFLFYHRNTVSSYLHPETQVPIDPSLPYYGLLFPNIMQHSNSSLKSLLRVPWAWGIFIRGDTFSQLSVQHFQREPAGDCSLPVRVYLYSILLGDRVMVEFVHTSSLSFKQRLIETKQALPNGSPVPSLDEVPLIPEVALLDIFLQISRSDGVGIELLPGPWRMLAAALRYWLLRCKPRPHSSLLTSLISSCVVTFKFPSRRQYTKLLSHKINHLIPYNLQTFHQISQWHAAYLDLYRLAQILDLAPISPSLFYNGNLLFHILLLREFRDYELPKLLSSRDLTWISHLAQVVEQ